MAEQEKANRSPLYTAARAFAWILVHTVLPMKFIHPERVAMDAPFILIANHSSALDPVVMGYIVKRYEITFLGKKELVRSPLGRWVFKHLHMIVVDRHNMDMEAMRACMRTLRNGGVLGIFPEGTRHHRGVMEEMESGVSLIALRSGAPLVPMYIDRKLSLFRRTCVYCGEPIPTEDLRAEGVSNQTGEALLARITETYRRMQEEAGRAVPAAGN